MGLPIIRLRIQRYIHMPCLCNACVDASCRGEQECSSWGSLPAAAIPHRAIEAERGPTGGKRKEGEEGLRFARSLACSLASRQTSTQPTTPS